MSELDDLYQDIILDHNKNPRNFKKLPNANRHAEGFNPLCGDHYTVYVKIDNEIIDDISFEGSGCAISKASASVMTSVLKGKNKDEARRTIELFHNVVTGKVEALNRIDELGKLAAFGGVSDYPVRVKCASLAWHTLKAALDNKQETVSTE